MTTRKPEWIKVRISAGERWTQLTEIFRNLDLNTVCQNARCPNRGECWQKGTATFLLLGETCTRRCRFCAINSGHPSGDLDEYEPQRVAQAIGKLNLKYVVLTMVTRDDLTDGGAAHIANTVRNIRSQNPTIHIETLVSDFGCARQNTIQLVKEAHPDVYAHNVEVVPQLQKKMRDQHCSWKNSISTLRWAKDAGAQVTKSSLMVGCGETQEQVIDAMRKLRTARVDILTIGQYLSPTKKHIPVAEYRNPTEFEWYRKVGLEMGFKYVASGPLVRSSYQAAEAYFYVISQEQDKKVENMKTVA